MMKPGSIVVFNWKKGGFFSSGQRLFTHYWINGSSPGSYAHSYCTHTAIISHDVEGIPSYFGAELATAFQPVTVFTEDSDVDYIVFEPIGFNEADLNIVLERIYKEYAARGYGFMQIAWFIYRWLMETFTHVDMRKKHNWFNRGTICSEVAFRNLSYLGEIEHGKEIPPIINQWLLDSAHAGDVLVMLLMMPTLFKITEQRWTTPLPKE
jgi:hypothetical protein